MHSPKNYIGTELELFEQARNWKSYFGSFIKPLLGKQVAEIGAGIGGTTAVLCNGQQDQWLCVEPDTALLREIDKKIKAGQLPGVCNTLNGFSSELKQQFDSLLYIDVIEHIENDRAELETAASLLTKEGLLFILVPAHQNLFSPFDKKIGHYRRYSRKTLKAIVPASLQVKKIYYLDSAGYFLSLVNRRILKQAMPTQRQVQFWDKIIIPLSRLADRLTGFQFGKSLLLIAQKKEEDC